VSRKLFIRTLAFVLLICIAVPTVALAASYNAKVYTKTMNVYEKASSSSKKLGTLKEGDKFKVTQESSGWVKINYGGKEGWCLKKCIKSLSHDKTMYTNKKAYVYKTASTSSTKLDTLSIDYPLYIVGESGSYYLVDDYKGKFTGYVLKSSLSTSKTNKYAVASSYKKSYNSQGSTTKCPSGVKSTQSYYAQSMGTASLCKYLVYIAECKLGCKYASGANNTTAFTNWGFVNSCFKALGYTIPGSIKSVGNVAKDSRISRSNLKIGDIVCFDCDTADKDPVDHIGIYVGSGYFIHSSPTAGCVVISNLNSKYYKNAFCWGRRVIK